MESTIVRKYLSLSFWQTESTTVRRLSIELLKIESIYSLSDWSNLIFGSSRQELNIVAPINMATNTLDKTK